MADDDEKSWAEVGLGPVGVEVSRGCGLLYLAVMLLIVGGASLAVWLLAEALG